MGAYDRIKCELKLPDGYTGELQTKDLNCEFANHIITANGRLMLQKGKKYEDANFHGILRFYGIGPHLLGRGYQATFIDGELKTVERIHA
jgi:hypothetical protein